MLLNLSSVWKVEWRVFQGIKKLDLEKTLFLTILFFAVFVSFINLFSQDKMPNNFTEFPLFIIKWFFFSIQLYAIMFIYYLFYWINHYVLINKVLRQKGMLVYALSFIFVVLILYPIAAQLTYWIASISYFGMNVFVEEGTFHGVNFLFPFMEMLISIPFILAIQWSKQSKEIATLEKEKSDAELNLLKQQINPHFFFNTLNNLYALSLKKDEATPDVILQLSELMRYVIYKGKEKSVKLKEEIKYIEDYCELQQIRLHKQMEFKFLKKIENENLQIPPLLFIILVENAFKHGIEPAEKDCFLHLHLESDENGLVFICENSFEENTAKKIAGIGLENLKQRLNLRFPYQHELTVLESKSTYKVVLRLRK